MASVKELLAEMKALVEQADYEAVKFDKGNKSAGGRIRKVAQSGKKVWQDIRIEVMSKLKEGKE